MPSSRKIQINGNQSNQSDLCTVPSKSGSIKFSFLAVLRFPREYFIKHLPIQVSEGHFPRCDVLAVEDLPGIAIAIAVVRARDWYCWSR
jgi:hypothetical protein